MKKTLLLLVFITFSKFLIAQETYTINNETLVLKTEVDGTLDLLWNTFNNEYRYFVRSNDGTFTELKNTKGEDKKYQEEYKQVLTNLTQLDAAKVKLTTYSLKTFISNYNASKNPNYAEAIDASSLKLRLGLFGGLTNQPFVENPNNENVISFGAELELVSSKPQPKQAAFFNVRHAVEHDDFKYSATQLALGYRYRVINTSSFNIYAQSKIVTYTASKSTLSYLDQNSNVVTSENTGSDFDVPFIFGIGADFKLGDNGYLTFVYDSLFGVFIDHQGNFPVDFAIGYKLNL